MPSRVLELADGPGGGLLLGTVPELASEERRAAARVRLRTPVEWSDEKGNSGTATVMDISITGVRVVGDLDGETLGVVLRLPEGAVELTARLVEAKPGPAGTKTVTRWHFEEPDPDAARILSEFVSGGVRPRPSDSRPPRAT